MPVPFAFPVVYLDPDYPWDEPVIEQHEGELQSIRLDREPYELLLDANGCAFHLIFGSHMRGHFLCIPDLQFGCELAELDDKPWNMHAILHVDNPGIDYEDATAITWALSLASSMIHH